MKEEQTAEILQEVAQIAFTVPDLEKAKAFYRDVLQLRFLFDAGTMSFFQCGAVRIMVGAGERPHDSGGAIVYFRVENLEKATQVLRSRGVRFTQEPHIVARMKSHDLWMAFLKDPAGNTFGMMSEIVRATDGGKQ